MKITSIDIKNYLQFKNLKIDLTYPKGHQKERQPLDKICIIGQSGTGKTNLLEVIKNRIDNDNVKTVFKNIESLSHKKIYFMNAEKNCTKIKQNSIEEEDEKAISRLQKEKEFLIASENYGIVHFDYKILDMAINAIRRKYDYTKFVNHEELDSVINIDNDSSWKLLKEKIDNYEKEKTKYTKKLFNKMYNTEYSKEESIADMRKWEAKNENILEKIADDINSIIKKFNLELKIDENTNSYEELIIKDLSNGNIIEYDDVSTGTKNLLSTFIPLKSYNPKDSIILIDEPENSFYPDIQTELTDLYMNVGENNQLIMATHSPLIASTFEPWEVVELKFDENNQIYRELYYDYKNCENHVDNYFLNPQLLTWTNILTQIFDLKKDSFSEREKKLMEYAMLKAKIKLIKNEEEREKKIDELMKLSGLLRLQN